MQQFWKYVNGKSKVLSELTPYKSADLRFFGLQPKLQDNGHMGLVCRMVCLFTPHLISGTKLFSW